MKTVHQKNKNDSATFIITLIHCLLLTFIVYLMFEEYLYKCTGFNLTCVNFFSLVVTDHLLGLRLSGSEISMSLWAL